MPGSVIPSSGFLIFLILPWIVPSPWFKFDAAAPIGVPENPMFAFTRVVKAASVYSSTCWTVITLTKYLLFSRPLTPCCSIVSNGTSTLLLSNWPVLGNTMLSLGTSVIIISSLFVKPWSVLVVNLIGVAIKMPLISTSELGSYALEISFQSK